MPEKIRDFMKEALKQAEKAGQANEVPVGAVIVRQERVVGSGRNAMIARRDPTAHAEMLALRQAARRIGNYRLLGADLYVTLEPCLMCYSAMVQARIRKLIYGAADPKTGIFSSGAFDRVQGIFNHRIAVESGRLGAESSRLLKDFFRARRGARAVEWDGLENRCRG